MPRSTADLDLFMAGARVRAISEILWRRTLLPELPDRPVRRTRTRKPNSATFIRQARKAGERGPVRIEHVNADGSRTIVTSTSEGAIERITEADAERMWHERIAKHAH
jgi:hypothetical protein